MPRVKGRTYVHPATLAISKAHFEEHGAVLTIENDKSNFLRLMLDVASKYHVLNIEPPGTMRQLTDSLRYQAKAYRTSKKKAKRKEKGQAKVYRTASRTREDVAWNEDIEIKSSALIKKILMVEQSFFWS